MVSQTEQFFRSYWQSRPAVRRNAALAGNMTLAEKLAWQDLLRRHLGLTGRTHKTLEVGAGVGAIAHILAGLRVHCTAVDWSADQLEVAQQRWDESKQGVRGSCRFVEGDADAIEADDQTFDSVLAVNVLSQLLNPQKALNEWQRVLKPGGKLVVVEDDRNSAEMRQAALDLQKAQLADDPLGAEWLEKLERCPLWQANGSDIEAALQIAGYQSMQHTVGAGQLVRTGRWRWRTYAVGYMIVSAETASTETLSS